MWATLDLLVFHFLLFPFGSGTLALVVVGSTWKCKIDERQQQQHRLLMSGLGLGALCTVHTHTHLVPNMVPSFGRGAHCSNERKKCLLGGAEQSSFWSSSSSLSLSTAVLELKIKTIRSRNYQITEPEFWLPALLSLLLFPDCCCCCCQRAQIACQASAAKLFLLLWYSFSKLFYSCSVEFRVSGMEVEWGQLKLRKMKAKKRGEKEHSFLFSFLFFLIRSQFALLVQQGHSRTDKAVSSV